MDRRSVTLLFLFCNSIEHNFGFNKVVMIWFSPFSLFITKLNNKALKFPPRSVPVFWLAIRGFNTRCESKLAI